METITNTTTINVAIVQDEALFGDLLSEWLSMKPGTNTLFTAADGLEMQTKIHKSLIPDVILMDIGMANMNGYRSAQWLNKRYPEKAVLALSALGDHDAIQGMMDCGAHGFVSKDQPREDLLAAIRAVHSHKKYINPRLKNGHQSITRYRSRKRFIDMVTPTRQQIMRLMANGYTNAQIADHLCTSFASVKKHTENLFKYFAVTKRCELVKKATDMGLISPQLYPGEGGRNNDQNR